MISRLLMVLAAVMMLVAGATANAASADRAKALKKTPGAKPRYFKTLTGGHSVEMKQRFLKEGNSKTVDVTAKLAKGSNKISKHARTGTNRNAVAARSANQIRQVQVIKINAKTLRARSEARFGDAERMARLQKNGGR